MKKSVMVKWVEALRSGKYPQAKYSLKTRHGYCCLGVLCEISKVNEFKATSSGGFIYDGKHSSLPKSVQKWAGMRSERGVLEDACTALDWLNDYGDANDFEAIAKVIEKEYKSL